MSQEFDWEVGEYDVAVTGDMIRFLERCGYPYVKIQEDLPSLDKRIKSACSEFACSHTFHPDFIDAVCRLGYFPMAVPLIANGYLMTPKIHTNRCIVNFAQMQFPSNTIKKAKKFDFSINKAFDDVARLCIACHGTNWLYPPLVRAFSAMHKNPSSFKTKLWSIEIWRENQLVAGELGYSVGSTYTSLTGAHTEASAGTVQLLCLSEALQRQGFVQWDLGMTMAYKKEMGGQDVERFKFLKLYRSLADSPCFLLPTEKINARAFLLSRDPIANDRSDRLQPGCDDRSDEVQPGCGGKEPASNPANAEEGSVMSKSRQKKLAKLKHKQEAQEKKRQQCNTQPSVLAPDKSPDHTAGTGQLD